MTDSLVEEVLDIANDGRTLERDAVLKMLRTRLTVRRSDRQSRARISRQLEAEYDGRVSELEQVIRLIENLCHHEEAP